MVILAVGRLAQDAEAQPFLRERLAAGDGVTPRRAEADVVIPAEEDGEGNAAEDESQRFVATAALSGRGAAEGSGTHKNQSRWDANVKANGRDARADTREQRALIELREREQQEQRSGNVREEHRRVRKDDRAEGDGERDAEGRKRRLLPPQSIEKDHDGNQRAADAARQHGHDLRGGAIRKLPADDQRVRNRREQRHAGRLVRVRVPGPTRVAPRNVAGVGAELVDLKRLPLDDRAREVPLRVLVPSAAAEKIGERNEGDDEDQNRVVRASGAPSNQRRAGGAHHSTIGHTAISFRSSATISFGSLIDCTCSAVTPGATSMRRNPSGVTSSTA